MRNLILILPGLLLWFSSSVSAQTDINRLTWLHRKVSSLPFDMAGPFVRLNDSGIIVFDNGATRISRNDGETWSDPRPVFADHTKHKAASPKMVRCTDGTLIFAYINAAEMVWNWNDERRDADPGTTAPTYVTRSTDDGRTWSVPVRLHREWTGDLRNMIVTSKGTVVLSSMQLWNSPGRHVMLTYSSKDHGQTWTRSNFIDLGGNGHHDGAVEGTIVELKDGRIWMLIRTNWDFFWEAFSEDEGVSWRTIRPSKIEASSSPGQLRRLKSGRLVLFWNRLMPTGWKTYPRMGGLKSTNSPQWSSVAASASREELSMAFSDDEGQSWTRPVVVAARNDQVSYPEVFEVRPGTMWVTSGYGKLRAIIHESDFLPTNRAAESPKP